MNPPFSEVAPGLEGTQDLETCKRKVESHHAPSGRWRRPLPTPYRPRVSCFFTSHSTDRRKLGASLRTAGKGPKY